MAYEIPKNLTKYSETFLFGMTMKQFFIAAVTLAANAIVIFKTQFPLWAMITILAPVNIIAVLILFGKIEEHIANKMNFKKSLQNIAYNDTAMKTFVDVKDIKDNIVVRQDGSMIAVLKVSSINFAILSDEDQEYTINAYRQWLRGLDYPVHIISRSTPLDISPWIKGLENKAGKTKHFKIFKQWMNQQITEHSVRNRMFYIIIQLEGNISSKPALAQLIDLFLGKASTAAYKEEDYQKAINKLAERVMHCSQTLKSCGVESKRLNTQELLQLYASYFTDRPNIHPNVITPIMNIDSSMHDKLAQEMKKVMADAQ